ncbi:MAG: hypothetical protein AAGI38_07150 [Bacteroidota bacterium]
MRHVFVLMVWLIWLVGTSFASGPLIWGWRVKDLSLTYTHSWVDGTFMQGGELFYDMTAKNCLGAITYRGIGMVATWDQSQQIQSFGAKARYTPYKLSIPRSGYIKLLFPYGFFQTTREFSVINENVEGYAFRPGLGVAGIFFARSPIHLRAGIEIGYDFYEAQLERNNSLVISGSIGIGIKARGWLKRKKND